MQIAEPSCYKWKTGKVENLDLGQKNNYVLFLNKFLQNA
jgi:hypothetical protein